MQNDKVIPTIFNEIVKTRVANYIDKEVREIISKKTDKIIKDVLSGLQVESTVYKEMLTYDTKLVVNAIYNGIDITQKGGAKVYAEDTLKELQDNK